MYIPEGLTEREILKVINSIVNQLCPSFVFGYYQLEDIKQEARIFAIQALPNFDPNKSRASKHRPTVSDQLYNFLRTHIYNHLKNLKRNKYERKMPPCDDCIEFNPKCKKCKKWANNARRNERKQNLLNSIAVDTTISEQSFLQEDSYNLIQEIFEKLSPDTRCDFRRLLDGVKISPHRHEKLKAEILQHLNVTDIEDLLYG